MSEYPGRYVVLEGIDGSGKSTQIELAKNYAEENELDVLFVREPGQTVLGTHLRALLLENKSVELSPEVESLMFTTDRLHTWKQETTPALQRGATVISDRSYRSTEIFQAAAGGVSSEKIRELTSLFLPERYINPDKLALLSISRFTWKNRLEKRFGVEAADKIESRDPAYSERVFSGYKQLEQNPHVTIIDAEPGPNEIFKQLKPVLFGDSAP